MPCRVERRAVDASPPQIKSKRRADANLVLDIHLAALLVLLLARERVVHAEVVRELGLGRLPVWKSKFYGAFDLLAIDATHARSSPLDRARTAAPSPRNDLVKNCRVHPTHWLIYTQPGAFLSLVFLGNFRLHRLDHALGSLYGALLTHDLCANQPVSRRTRI